MVSARQAWVLILDYGSQYTQLIARRIRESHVYCEILPCTASVAAIREAAPSAIVLSGGPASVYAPGAPTTDAALFDLGIPILGICYGMQLMSHVLGGRVERAEAREYGPAQVCIDRPRGLFEPFAEGESIEVWMSHGDRLAVLPQGFEAIGSSANAPFCAIADESRKIYGLQFHPEVAHTPRGGEILRAFLFDVAGLSPSWTPASFAREAVERVRTRVGPEDGALCGL